MKKITLLLADDHTIVRAGLRILLEAAGDMRVVGEAEDGLESVRETKRLQPDVVLLDLAMPVLNGLEAARQIRKEVPSTKILILSAYNHDRYVQEALEAGASGYLVKETAGSDLLRAIREVQKGNAFFSPAVTNRLLKQCREMLLHGHPVGTHATTLTPRQTDLLQMVAEGYANKQIALFLSLSVKTVEKHRQSLMDKLNIHEAATLTRYAISSGVIGSKRTPVPITSEPPPEWVSGQIAPTIPPESP